MKLFGARRASGWRRAIKPGMTSVSDLTASLGDVTAPLTRRPRRRSPGATGTLALHKVGGALAEFGT